MDGEQIKAYCLGKPWAYEDRPFGEVPVCYKVNGRIFAQLSPDRLTVKCTAFSGQAFRQAYPGVVVRGYHCPPVQQPYWNTIDLAQFPPEDLPMMIDHAYETVVAGFPKKVRNALREGTSWIGKTVTVTVDRPLGSCHPNHPDIVYPVNYGYVAGIPAPDGEEQDAYLLGVERPVERFPGTVIAVIHRKDDVEDKWVVAPAGTAFSREEIWEQVQFQERFFDSEILF